MYVNLLPKDFGLLSIEWTQKTENFKQLFRTRESIWNPTILRLYKSMTLAQ
jgi:hypothetical protein